MAEEDVRPPPKKMRILELFSGIGGMHYAGSMRVDILHCLDVDGSHTAGLFLAAMEWESRSPESRKIEVVESCDVSEMANKVYSFNFKKNPLTKSIEHLDAAFLDSLCVDAWLMSPPCESSLVSRPCGHAS